MDYNSQGWEHKVKEFFSEPQLSDKEKNLYTLRKNKQ